MVFKSFNLKGGDGYANVDMKGEVRNTRDYESYSEWLYMSKRCGFRSDKLLDCIVIRLCQLKMELRPNKGRERERDRA